MGTTSWSPLHPPHPPPGEELMLHPVQERGAAAGALPCPSPTALLAWAPLGPLTPGCWALRLCGLEQETENSIGGCLAASYYKGCWSQYMCEHRHTGTETGTHTHWACTQGHAFTYSYLGWGPLRAKGTESLVLGTQLLVVLGRAMPPGPGERRKWGDIGKGSQRRGLL